MTGSVVGAVVTVEGVGSTAAGATVEVTGADLTAGDGVVQAPANTTVASRATPPVRTGALWPVSVYTLRCKPFGIPTEERVNEQPATGVDGAGTAREPPDRRPAVRRGREGPRGRRRRRRGRLAPHKRPAD